MPVVPIPDEKIDNLNTLPFPGITRVMWFPMVRDTRNVIDIVTTKRAVRNLDYINGF